MFKDPSDIVNYWDNRYVSGRNSGAGSYGDESEVKASYVNNTIEKNNIKTILELGCGDGNQLSMFDIENYVGYDISPDIIKKCKDKFKGDETKIFRTFDINKSNIIDNHEMVISLDVIFHLVIDGAFERYMNVLFDSSKYVLIYTMQNIEENTRKHAEHVLFRDVLSWTKNNAKNYELIENDKFFNKEFLFYKKIS